ncbi:MULTISPECIES: alpha/beta fold hydrolase [unclassified Janthinobacterium]|uniref:alpha/beta fold hydrolase n=1 Tax=unclassified Janthinobacterium TaxID=2610881 RepID=UPI0006865D19|nr:MULTISPECIES: alpha/beta hydrolase [unclassified Janthinobacterium]MEC5159535.1 pimeloyl-ACP methyl ester carboxylesterase [Janthinobacterium sp. CG_S6]
MRVLKWLLAAGLVAVAAATGLVYAAPEWVTRLAIDADRQRAGLVRKEIVLPDGLRFAYLEGGQGEPLMLLHGFGADKDNFTRVARLLTPHYRVIVPDLTGFGESARLAGADYRPRAQAARLRAFAGALGVGKLHVGGSSMGGQIALTYAAAYPAEVASLWLLAPSGVWSAPKSELADIYQSTGRNPLIARSKEEFARTFDFVMNDPPFVPRPILDVIAKGVVANAPLAEYIFKQLVGESVEARASGLATPALIVWGQQDRAIHVGSAAVLQRLMPRSQVVVMPGVGHLPMVERPRQSADDYLRFRAGTN